MTTATKIQMRTRRHTKVFFVCLFFFITLKTHFILRLQTLLFMLEIFAETSLKNKKTVSWQLGKRNVPFWNLILHSVNFHADVGVVVVKPYQVHCKDFVLVAMLGEVLTLSRYLTDRRVIVWQTCEFSIEGIMRCLVFSNNDVVSPVLHFMPLFSCKQWRTAENKTTKWHVETNRTGTVICEEAASS